MPRKVSPFFRGLKRQLTPTQFDHLRMLVLAFAAAWGRKNIMTLRRILPNEAHHANLSRFLRAPWNAAGALDSVARQQLAQLRLKPGQTLYLILDDTKVRKRGKKMTGLHKVKDPATGRFFFGHTFVCVALYANGVTVPLCILPYYSAEFCRKTGRPFRKLTALAVEAIGALTFVPSGVEVAALFDAYYACRSVFDACKIRRFRAYTTLPANRNLFIGGKKHKAGIYSRWYLARHGQAVRLGKEHAGSHRRFRAAALNASIKGGRRLRIVFSQRKGERKTLVLASTDRGASASRIIDRYLYRWNIEVFFKDAKQLLGLTHYQCLDLDAATRHVHLAALAYALLTHLRLAAPGAQGKQKNKRLASHDTTRKRQADLRNLLLEDSFAVLYGKARRNKSLQKAVSLLKAA